MFKFDCIEKPLSLLFYRYGRVVAKNPLPFILLPVLLTAAMSVGLLKMNHISDAIYLFTPTDAKSKMERQAIHDLWPLVNGSYIPGRAVTQSREVQITVHARDGKNILEKPYADAVQRLDAFIQKEVRVEYMNKSYGYKDLCLASDNTSCPGTKHVKLISDLFQHGVNITYPTVRFGNTHGYIGSSLGGVTVSRLDGSDLETKSNSPMILAGAKSWLIIYHLQFYPPEMSHISGLWEKEFQRAMENYPEDPDITFTYFHSQTLAEELKRNANTLVPRFLLAFTILMLFSTLCNMSTCDDSYYIDWIVSKPLLGVLGVVNALMGIACAIGVLNLLKFPYNDIIGVMPFLVVAVGVDNSYIMMGAIRRTNRAHSTTRRMGEAMSDAAISMLITALTDAFSFAVGIVSTIPAVKIFCFYTCTAIVVTFIFQITFFAGLLALAVTWEEKGLHCVFLRPAVSHEEVSTTGWCSRLFWLGTKADPDPSNVQRNLKESSAALFFQNWYGPVLMKPLVRALAVVWFFIYMAFAIYGCMQLREGLEPVNLLVADSYAIPHYRALEKEFWHYGASVQVVVNNAPDMRDVLERAKIKAMVRDFANAKHTIGDDSVQFWLYEMEDYYRTVVGTSTETATDNFYKLAHYFFQENSHEYWPQDVKWGKMEDGTPGITAFRFMVGLRDISTSVEQQDATATLRELAAEFPKYNVTTFMPLWLFTDQYALVVPNTVQNIAIAIFVMVVISLLLIPQPMCSLWVALAIASIDVGVIGYMTLWGVNLDAISMITIIMSIGLSVDYSAHITYGYVVSAEEDPNDRIRRALGALGWPLTQGAISTILAVVVLADVPAYMIVTFFKTVFLAITLGLLHGLVFLPVCLSLFVRGACISATEGKNYSAMNYTRAEQEHKEKKHVRFEDLEPVGSDAGLDKGAGSDAGLDKGTGSDAGADKDDAAPTSNSTETVIPIV